MEFYFSVSSRGGVLPCPVTGHCGVKFRIGGVQFREIAEIVKTGTRGRGGERSDAGRNRREGGLGAGRQTFDR
jgi:hypothetical protein